MKRLASLTTLLVAGLFLFPSGAQATPVPLGQFGASDGNLVDTANWTQLSHLAGVLTPDGAADGSFFRGAVHWAPTATAEWSQTTYDNAVTNAWADNLMFLPEIHTSKQGGGGYIDPLTCTGTGCGTTAFEQAVEDFALRYGPNGSYISDNPGTTFPGITRYEMWNEPNSNTGTLNATNTDDSDPVEIDKIIHAESVGLVAAATQSGWLSQLQLACCALGTGGNGNHAYSLQYFKEMMNATQSGWTNTLWQDFNPTGAQPGVVTIHTYYGTTDPVNCTDTGGDASNAEKCPKFLADYWQPYIDSEQTAFGYPTNGQVGLGITEGGYSGPVNCSYTNTVTEAQQSTDDESTINTYRADAASGLDLEFLAYYKAEDDDTSGTTGSTCWQYGLAPVYTSAGTWKPWATEYNNLIAADHTVQGSTAAASDTYTRTVSRGWGTADTGGAWTQTTGPSSDLSVNGSEGVDVLSSNTTTDTIGLAGMTPIDSQDTGVDATMPSRPGSASVTLILEDRVDSAGDYYKASFQVFAGGNVTVTIRSHVIGQTDTTLATQTQFCTVQAGTPYHFEFDAEGLSPTALNAGCYVATGTPKGITASDSTAALQDSGTNRIAINPGSSMPVPFETDFDNYSVAAP